MKTIYGLALVGLLITSGSAFAAKAKGDPEAFKQRRTECSAEWKAAKVAAKTDGQTWPKFWSACNTRLKSAAAK